MNAGEIQRRWNSFQPVTPDWRREGGARLLITPHGYGVREDCVGPLYLLAEGDLAVGRDERRLNRLVKLALSKQSKTLALAMEVPRDEVLGRLKTLQTTRTRKSDCRCVLKDGQIVKPDFIFVTYQTPSGKRRYRRLTS